MNKLLLNIGPGIQKAVYTDSHICIAGGAVRSYDPYGNGKDH